VDVQSIKLGMVRWLTSLKAGSLSIHGLKFDLNILKSGKASLSILHQRKNIIKKALSVIGRCIIYLAALALAHSQQQTMMST
jgi:hypothetical protein